MLAVVVVVGLLAGWRIGVVAFYVAAGSQILLYTLLRDWVTSVPVPFSVSAEQRSYLNTLVIFHLVTLIVVTGALGLRRRINS